MEMDSNPGPDQVITYTYDALDRLKSASYSSGTYFFYDYDKEGNRIRQTLNGNMTSYVYVLPTG